MTNWHRLFLEPVSGACVRNLKVSFHAALADPKFWYGAPYAVRYSSFYRPVLLGLHSAYTVGLKPAGNATVLFTESASVAWTDIINTARRRRVMVLFVLHADAVAVARKPPTSVSQCACACAALIYAVPTLDSVD